LTSRTATWMPLLVTRNWRRARRIARSSLSARQNTLDCRSPGGLHVHGFFTRRSTSERWLPGSPCSRDWPTTFPGRRSPPHSVAAARMSSILQHALCRVLQSRHAGPGRRCFPGTLHVVLARYERSPRSSAAMSGSEVAEAASRARGSQLDPVAELAGLRGRLPPLSIFDSTPRFPGDTGSKSIASSRGAARQR